MADRVEIPHIVLIAHDTDYPGYPGEKKLGRRYDITLHEITSDPDSHVTIGRNRSGGKRENKRHVPALEGISSKHYDVIVNAKGKLRLLTHKDTITPTYVNGTEKVEKETKHTLALNEGDTVHCALKRRRNPNYLFIHVLDSKQRAELWQTRDLGTKKPTGKQLEGLGFVK
ncbi:hypothetical protein HZC09_06270 [Candidatus Micrarchaeota archaeon]|nr:hypothetical protein [Candidatus Micrarchaeota archaeon]